jgi:hypothetical protein
MRLLGIVQSCKWIWGLNTIHFNRIHVI